MTKQLNLFNSNIPQSRKIMNPNLGLPYKGAKRKIAHKLLQAMADLAPQANYFYDLFGGGGSMSLCAYANGYNVTYNELSKQTFLYFDLAISQSQKPKGKYGGLPDNYYQFVSREEFHKIKAEITAGNNSHYNSFVIYAGSFSNNCHSYLWSNDREIIARMGHNLVIDNDKQGAEFWNTYFAERGSVGGIYDYMQKNIYPALTWNERRLIFVDITLKLEAIRVASMGDKFIKGDFDTLKNMTQKALCQMIDEHNPNLEKKNFKRANRLNRLNGLKELKQLQRLQRLERIERIERIEKIKNVCMPCLNLFYDAVSIQSEPNQTILYADPPYINTSDYKEQKGGGFNHEAFYQWCVHKAKEGYNVFISEYAMPEDRFKCVYSTEVLSTLCGADKANKKTEKLFIPIV